MKSFLIVLIFLATSSAQAKIYECIGQPGEPIIQISTEEGQETFQYFVDGKLTLHLNLPTSAIHNSQQGAFPNIYIFHQYWGETILRLYGKVVESGALFDIYVSGMEGYVVRALKDYSCR